jgi:hypothetical protein
MPFRDLADPVVVGQRRDPRGRSAAQAPER